MILKIVATFLFLAVSTASSAQVFQNRPDYGRADSSNIGNISIPITSQQMQSGDLPGTQCGSASYNNPVSGWYNYAPCQGQSIVSIYTTQVGAYGIPSGSGSCGDPADMNSPACVYQVTTYYNASSYNCPSGYSFSNIAHNRYSCIKN
jgi:hypothetical protein